jgi:hypothetical protein
MPVDVNSTLKEVCCHQPASLARHRIPPSTQNSFENTLLFALFPLAAPSVAVAMLSAGINKQALSVSGTVSGGQRRQR